MPLTASSLPSKIPYPYWAVTRDVTEQDWQTFLNYLIPDHAARANANLADRKSQAGADPSLVNSLDSKAGRDYFVHDAEIGRAHV